MPDTGIITTYESGVDLVVEWNIEDFFNLPETDGESYESPVFFFGSERWCLEIFPNGSKESGSSGRVDLGLCKHIGSRRYIKQSFSLSLKTVKEEKYNEQHFSKDFGKYYPENYHEILRFIPKSELTKRRSEFAPEGYLTVICTMKSSKSARSDTGKEHKENSENTGVNASTQTEEKDSDGSLCQDFKNLLLEGLNHDLILKVGDKELQAHRDVLRARSRVFKSMLDYDMKEKKSGIIDIPDCDPLAMEQFLFYIYSGNIEVFDQSNMLNLYYIADKYEMKGLKKDCSDFIKESLSQANICDVIQLALNHSDSSLLESTTAYFRKNMLGIMRTVEWQVFLKENSTVANELLIKAVENLSNVKSRI